jgi:hypothetical protein
VTSNVYGIANLVQYKSNPIATKLTETNVEPGESRLQRRQTK